jgi:hypothetical protein
MATFDYAEMQAVAHELITEFGQSRGHQRASHLLIQCWVVTARQTSTRPLSCR